MDDTEYWKTASLGKIDQIFTYQITALTVEWKISHVDGTRRFEYFTLSPLDRTIARNPSNGKFVVDILFLCDTKNLWIKRKLSFKGLCFWRSFPNSAFIVFLVQLAESNKAYLKWY